MALKPEIAGELRGMVREVLARGHGQPRGARLTALETVRIGSDAELQAFVSRG